MNTIVLEFFNQSPKKFQKDLNIAYRSYQIHSPDIDHLVDDIVADAMSFYSFVSSIRTPKVMHEMTQWFQAEQLKETYFCKVPEMEKCMLLLLVEYDHIKKEYSSAILTDLLTTFRKLIKLFVGYLIRMNYCGYETYKYVPFHKEWVIYQTSWSYIAMLFSRQSASFIKGLKLNHHEQLHQNETALAS